MLLGWVQLVLIASTSLQSLFLSPCFGISFLIVVYLIASTVHGCCFGFSFFDKYKSITYHFL